MTDNEDAGSASLADILLSNRPRLRAYLLARGAGDIADDLLQEMWIKASRLDRNVEPSALSYLFRMAERLLLDTWRQAGRRSARDTSWSQLYEQGEGSSSENHLIAREEINIATQRLQAMGPRVEYVFRRYRLEGATQQVIAGELGVSLSTVEKDLRKAYVALLQIRTHLDAV
ncbi:RNA polymerase sigma factor [Novosphingobium sp. P6W]|uniref:RNA polymerase sigma factor n=1 Tax=Novosphingobium sp. P6W TaxID=1609758 RepID=UPI0005C31BC2|nr:RNA polymerase sigma factor [Novosphingobium sp. P6W]AXB80421.1 RNA polymerase sigma factor [Novosphingobium sp. P6W]KIS31306.1 RNA polymerase sigma-70 factor [Novosphingobium sp. P6W]